MLDGEVPVEPRLENRVAPASVERILAADCSMIDEITLDLGGLVISFRRSGGHTPYRESFFDELRLHAHATLELRVDEVAEVLRYLWRRLGVVAASGTPLFSGVWAEFEGESGPPPAAIHSIAPG